MPHEKEYSDSPNYYLAFASGLAEDGETKDTSLDCDGLFIGPKITYEEAKSIMIEPTYTQVKANNVIYSYVVSVYTYWQSDIVALMSDPLVGYSTSTSFYHPERHNGGLPHYHPMDKYFVAVPFKDVKTGKKYTKNYRPHAFYMFNNVTSVTGIRNR